MTLKKCINQSGERKCSICKHEFEWSYELTLIHGTKIESEYGTIPSEIKMNPDKRVGFNMTENDKVEFKISCPKCNYTYKTPIMPMIKHT